jgi:hypothetical protein
MISRVLSRGFDRASLIPSWFIETPGKTFFLRGGMEEIRAGLGSDDERVTARSCDSAARRRALTRDGREITTVDSTRCREV